jgi:hypothetical protein
MSPVYRLRVIAAALLLMVLGNSDALAWGDLGHKVICEIALRRVTPTTRAAIDALMKADPEYSSFSDACAWPDHPRKRASEHYLNLPRNSRGLAADDCAGAPACVVTAIRKDAAVLAAAAAPSLERQTALKYLGHWVGDIHQPLHVSFADDRGGNNIRISGDCQSNLHSAWDTCLVVSAVGSDPIVAATKLLEALTAAQAQAWTQSAPKDWANESFAITERPMTSYCLFAGNDCEPGATVLRIDKKYVSENAPVVREQLLKAGIRLASLLDQALAGPAR